MSAAISLPPTARVSKTPKRPQCSTASFLYAAVALSRLGQSSRDYEACGLFAETSTDLYLGEFGAYREANMDDRALWTRAVAREAEKWGFSWSYWEFCSEFGAYDLAARRWRPPLLNALLNAD
jgi:hypothetical protein